MRRLGIYFSVERETAQITSSGPQMTQKPSSARAHIGTLLVC